MFIRRHAWMLGLLAVAALAGGCQDNLRAERDALFTQNQELQQRYSQSLAELEAAQADRGQLVQQVAEMQGQLQQTRQAPTGANTGFEQIAGVTSEAGAGVVTVRVPGDVLFSAGKADLRESAKKTLSQVADVLKNQYAGRTIRVEGYTDADPIRKSKWKDNLELSSARAMAVERYLATQGLDADQIYSAGFGSANPRASNRTAEGKAQNRRVEIVVEMR